MPSSKSPLRLSDSVSSRVSRALRKAASRRLSGFTLAELIVVIAILAVLATVGLLALSGYREDARDSAVKTNVRSVYAAIAAESATLQKSARCFIRHSPTHALTGGAVVMFDGGAADALVGGDCGTPGTNYSAGNPDYAALKLDPAKFRISLLSSPRLAASVFGGFRASADEYVADPTLLLVGAADLTDESGSKPRVRTFVQVAAVLPSETSYVAGDFPSGDVDDGAVAGLIKDAAYTESSTGALVDGAPAGAPAPCGAGEVSGYSVPALSSGQRQEVRKDVANGEGVATARCSYGTVRIENETAQCDPDYVPGSPVPSCVRDACGWTFPADAVSNEITPGGTGTWTFDETPGTCRFKCAPDFTWDGSACKADCTVAASSPSYQGLPYGLVANLPVAHGATAAGTGTHAFGFAPLNGTLSAEFLFSCSDGTASVQSVTPLSGTCQPNHTWNSEWSVPSCSADVRTVNCDGTVPQNGTATTGSQYSQTYDGLAGAWIPAYSWAISQSDGASECLYSCNANWVPSGGSCVWASRTVSCTGLPQNASWNSVSQITQTWNGSAWAPDSAGTHNATASTTECRFACSSNYIWNAGSCSLAPYFSWAGSNANPWTAGWTALRDCDRYNVLATTLNNWAIRWSGTCGENGDKACLESWIYRIDPSWTSPYNAYCDMSVNGGWWTLVLSSSTAYWSWPSGLVTSSSTINTNEVRYWTNAKLRTDWIDAIFSASNKKQSLVTTASTWTRLSWKTNWAGYITYNTTIDYLNSDGTSAQNSLYNNWNGYPAYYFYPAYGSTYFLYAWGWWGGIVCGWGWWGNGSPSKCGVLIR